jgi:hypothetical protein
MDSADCRYAAAVHRCRLTRRRPPHPVVEREDRPAEPLVRERRQVGAADPRRLHLDHLVAIGSNAARKWAALLSVRIRRSVGSMPKARKKFRSWGWPADLGQLKLDAARPPISSTTVRPREATVPEPIGPAIGKLPSWMSRTCR